MTTCASTPASAPATLYIDFETSFDPAAGHSLSHQSMQAYIQDPRTRLLGAAVCMPGVFPARFVPADRLKTCLTTLLPRARRLVAHNALFDTSVITMHPALTLPLPRPPPSPDHCILGCTKAMANYLISQGSTPHVATTSLASLSIALLPPDLAARYAKGDTANIVQAAQALSASAPADMRAGVPEYDALAAYALNDLGMLMALDTRLAPQMPDVETRLIDLHLRALAETPLVLDTGLLDSFANASPDPRSVLLRKRSTFLAALRVLAPDVLTKGAPDPTTLAKTSPLMQGLAQHADPRVRALHALKVEGSSNIVRTRAANLLDAAANAPRIGGLPRFGCPVDYFGTHTGRTTAGQSLNVSNMPRPARDGAKGLRHALRAPDGHVLVAADSSQIETRVLAWLAGCEPMLSAFRAGLDIYVEFARVLYRVPPHADVTPQQRQVAKSAVLGLGFGAGSVGFRTYCQRAGITLTVLQAQEAVAAYRQAYPDIPHYWYTAFRGAMRDGRCLLPSGRLMVWPDVRETFDGWTFERPAVFSANRRTPERVSIWHGQVAENLVQATARDVVMHQVVAAADRMPGARLVLTAYDEAVFAVRVESESHARDVLSAAFSAPPPWASTLPVACVVHAAKSYGELK